DPTIRGLRRGSAATAARTRLARRELAPRALGAGLVAQEDTQQLGHPTDEQSLLVDLDPRTGRRRKDDMVSRTDRHLQAGRRPPVDSRADREDDPMLGRWLVGAGGDDDPRAAEAVRLELLDHDPVEQRTELMSHGSSGLA